jgi:ubiquinone/menaquinone biosynthesis C-methylase UbiE
MMDRINIKSGARAVDVGCGPIGITNLLSDRVGANGVVIGVEREPRFFEMARSEQSKRGLRNVQLVNADALKTGLDKNSCDFVHERLVLINIPLASPRCLSMVMPKAGPLVPEPLWRNSEGAYPRRLASVLCAADHLM